MRDTLPPVAGRLSTQAREHWPLLAAIALGLAVRVVFWAYTERRFEDGLITITHARNAAEGLGLTHHLGEGPVHGFTSALSVLVPLPGELIAEGGGFTAIRLVSLAAFAAAAGYAYGICRELSVNRWGVVFVLAYLAFDQNQIFYGMAGMETQIAVAVLLAGAYHVLRGELVASGVALGLALLARPDFVLWVAPAYVALAMRDRIGALRAAAVSAAICLPWLVFTTVYYGSPVPNTIRAKSQVFSPDLPAPLAIGDWIDLIDSRLALQEEAWKLFSPFYEAAAVFDAPFPNAILGAIVAVFLVAAVVGVLSSWRISLWRPVIAFVVLFALYRVFALPPVYFHWYYPPFIAAVVILAAIGLTRLARLSQPAVVVLAVGLAAAYAVHIPFSLPLERRVQTGVEDAVRTPVGEYLREVVGEGETVTAESSGYFGYYSRATLHDFPGLTSPTSVEALGELPRTERSLEQLIEALQPDWLVLRPSELENLQALFPATAARYETVRDFATPDPVDLSRGGLSYLSLDTAFVVLERRP